MPPESAVNSDEQASRRDNARVCKVSGVGKRHIQTVLSLFKGERLRKLSGFDVIARLLLQA